MAFNEDSSASGHDEPWIQWFCGLKGHEMFCEVERSYIEDGFNLYGLRACVSNFSDCLDLILDRIGPDDSDDSHLTQSACALYGLIHARYIITAHGLDAMYNKYAAKDFGTCPLLQCNGQPVLPVGLKDEIAADTVKIYCPKCQCVYHTPPLRSRANINTGVDGAAFGTTFPHLFLMTFSNLVPDPLPAESNYIPRVFGFRVHQSLPTPPLPSEITTAEEPPPCGEKVAADQQANNNRAKTTADGNTKHSNNDDDDEDKSPVAGDEPGATQQATGATATTTVDVAGSTTTGDVTGSGVNMAANSAAGLNNNSLTTNMAGRPRIKAKRGRKDDGANVTTAVAPTFLMENPVKRRKRGTGNS